MLLTLCLVAEMIILMIATNTPPDRCYISCKKNQEVPVPVPEPVPIPLLKQVNNVLKKTRGLSVPVSAHALESIPSMIPKLLSIKNINLYRPVMKNIPFSSGVLLNVGKIVVIKHQEVRAAVGGPVPVPLTLTLTVTFYHYHLNILQKIPVGGPVPVPVSVPVPVPSHVNFQSTFYSYKLHILFTLLTSLNHVFKESLLNVALPLTVPLHFTFYSSHFKLIQTFYPNSLYTFRKIYSGGAVSVFVPVLVPVPVPAPLPSSKLVHAVCKYKKKDI
jgi:hypothetical protein